VSAESEALTWSWANCSNGASGARAAPTRTPDDKASDEALTWANCSNGVSGSGARPRAAPTRKPDDKVSAVELTW
jgi:hypothetical protein